MKSTITLGSHSHIVPTRSLISVLRVPIDVRRALGITVFEVRDDDSVVEHFV